MMFDCQAQLGDVAKKMGGGPVVRSRKIKGNKQKGGGGEGGGNLERRGIRP